MALGVSVSWLIEQRQLGLVVLAGASQLERRIEWVHSIELADPAPWLRGGELLLTTGLHLPADGAGQRGYVDSLHLAGVAALGFGIGLSHARVPDAMLTAADAVGLPLLQVPLPTPFIAVARAVTERIAEQQYEGVTRASRIQPRMTRAALHGGTRAVVKELATATGGRVLLLGDDNAVMAAYPRAARQLAGAVVSPITYTSYAAGGPLAIKGFTVAILGGLGNSGGAVAAGLALGVVESFAVSVLPAAYKDVVTLTLLLAVLVVRPSGLFASGEAARLKEF